MRSRLAVLLALTIMSKAALAQTTGGPQPIGTAQLIGMNAAIGGLTAGLWRTAARGSFWRGFTRGAAAGAVVYAGKRVVGEGSSPGWWIGRHIAALGSSEVSNAALGRPFLQTTVLPVGPIRIHIDRKARRRISPRLDLAASIAAMAIAVRPGARFALRESASTGAMVFLVRENSDEIGGTAAGVITLSELTPDGDFPGLQSKRSVLSHELVHASQYDFVFAALSDPIQSAIARRNSWGRRISRFVDINLVFPLQLGANELIDYQDRPWEREAVSFGRYSR